MSSTGENVLENRLFKYETSQIFPINQVTDSFPRFLASAKYHDLVIECQETEFHVHRVVVCSGSTFFEKMCDSGFKVSPSNLVHLQSTLPSSEAMESLSLNPSY